MQLAVAASAVLQSGGRSLNPALPLRLRAFDQTKVMFTCLAASVAVTAIRNSACLVGGERLVLYLNQVKDKRSMAQFRPWIGDKSPQTLWKIMRGRYMSRKEEQRVRGHLPHLGASVLLIEGDTELGAIHHRPLRPVDKFYDSTLLLIPCNWTHPLSLKVSPLAWEQVCWRCWMKGRDAERLKTSPVFSFHPKQLGMSIFEGKTALCTHHTSRANVKSREKCHNATVSIFQQYWKQIIGATGSSMCVCHIYQENSQIGQVGFINE